MNDHNLKINPKEDSKETMNKDIKSSKTIFSNTTLSICLALILFFLFLMFEISKTITPQDHEIFISCNTNTIYNHYQGKAGVCQLRLNTFSQTPDEIIYSVSKQEFKYQVTTSFLKGKHTWIDRVKQKTKEYQSISINATFSYSRPELINTFLHQNIRSISELHKRTKTKLDELIMAYIDQNKDNLISRDLNDIELKKLSAQLSRQTRGYIKLIHLKTQDTQKKSSYISELNFSNLIPLTPIELESKIVKEIKFNPRWLLNYLRDLLGYTVLILFVTIIIGFLLLLLGG